MTSSQSDFTSQIVLLARTQEKISDAQLGLQELAKAARNPKALVEAMEMLKDPEIAAEVGVSRLLANPSIQCHIAYYRCKR